MHIEEQSIKNKYKDLMIQKADFELQYDKVNNQVTQLRQCYQQVIKSRQKDNCVRTPSQLQGEVDGLVGDLL